MFLKYICRRIIKIVIKKPENRDSVKRIRTGSLIEYIDVKKKAKMKFIWEIKIQFNTAEKSWTK